MSYTVSLTILVNVFAIIRDGITVMYTLIYDNADSAISLVGLTASKHACPSISSKVSIPKQPV